MSLLDWFLADNNTGEKTDGKKTELGKGQTQPAQLPKFIPVGYSYTVPSDAKEIFRWHTLSRVYLSHVNKKKAYGLCLFILALTVMTGFLIDWIFTLVLLLIITVVALFISIKPPEVENMITDQGIYASEIFFPWEMLKDFNLTKLLDSNLLVIQTKNSHLQQIEVIIEEKDISTIRGIIGQILPVTDTLKRKWVDYILLTVAKLIR